MSVEILDSETSSLCCGGGIAPQWSFIEKQTCSSRTLLLILHKPKGGIYTDDINYTNELTSTA